VAISKSSIIGSISGKLVGAEFAVYKGRQIIKSQKNKPHGSTANKISSQAQHGAAMRYFSELSEANKEAWRVAAQQKPRPDRFGVPRALSAMQLFLTIPHDFRFSVPVHYEDTPPMSTNAFRNPPTATWTAPYNCNVTYSVLGTPGDMHILSLYASRFNRPHQRSSRNWRKVGLVYQAVAASVDFDASLEALHVGAIAGESINLRIQWYMHGFWPIWYDIGITTIS